MDTLLVRLLPGLVMLGSALLPVWALAQAGRGEVAAETSRHEVVAAVVYKLANFVEWPSSTPAGYAICLYGDGALAEALRAYQGKPALRGTVSVRVIPRPLAVPDCQVAMVAGDGEGLIERVAESYRGRAVLIAGEGDGAIDRGAMIGLAVSEDHIVFDVGRIAASREGLVLSSKFLRLARRVK